MITNAFRMRRSEYVLGRPRGRLAGAGGQGRWSMSSTRLTRRLIWRSISVPPQCGCVVTEILRGQLCCDDAWHGCFIYDHVSFRCLGRTVKNIEIVTWGFVSYDSRYVADGLHFDFRCNSLFDAARCPAGAGLLLRIKIADLD